MKKRLLILIFCFFSLSKAQAGLHFGLGNAVAHRSAELIDEAGQREHPVGEAVAATLALCSGNSFLDSLPIDMTMIGGIDPLGHVQPTGHTFPTDHIYFYSSTSTAYTPPVYAPADVHITEIASYRYLNASPVFTDYNVTFYACQNFRGVYGHVRNLTATLSNVIAQGGGSCFTYGTGGSSIERCAYNTNIAVNSGTLLGYVQTSGTLDFGAIDTRITPIPYVSPSRRSTYQLYTVCPVDYFTPALKSTMEAKLGRFDGGYMRVTAPICGTIDEDVANTAKGYWYKPGSPDSPEDPHLSLINNNVYAPQQTISVGNSLPNSSGYWAIFTANSGAGQVNREFSEVTADGNTYCYDSFFDPIGQAIGAGGPTFILRMLTSSTLRFERQGPGLCGAGPWTFTSNAVDFQR